MATWIAVAGLSVLPLDSVGSVHTTLVRWAPGTQFKPHSHWGGEEILCWKALFRMNRAITRPALGCATSRFNHRPFSIEGCLIYVKVGHLPA